MVANDFGSLRHGGTRLRRGGSIPSNLRSRCARRSPAFPAADGYNEGMQNLAICLQALVAAAVFFVWVVRYANIVEEFRQFGLPEWLRDLVGILKLTLSLLLLIGIDRPPMAVIGGIGIASLMAAAVITHLRIGNPAFKMLPSLSLLVSSAVIAWINYGRLGS